MYLSQWIASLSLQMFCQWKTFKKIILFLLEFSNAQSRIRELTHFSTEQSSMYLNLMGGKAFNLYSDSYDWTCWIWEKRESIQIPTENSPFGQHGIRCASANHVELSAHIFWVISPLRKESSLLILLWLFKKKAQRWFSIKQNILK